MHLITLSLSFLVICLAEEGHEICNCFEEFEPRKEGDHWLCIGIKNSRGYQCGEEKPPLCMCKENGTDVDFRYW